MIPPYDSLGPDPKPEMPDPHAPIFEDTLSPHRSLGPRGFRVLMLATCVLSTVITIPFFLLRAWPIVGFMGLDVLGVYLAFRLNFRSAQAREHFRVTYLELTFARIAANGARREWRLAPAWVRLERVDDEEYGPQRLTLHSRGRTWRIAQGVGPERKAECAGGLAKALVEARRGPRYS
jgi:uncharacterized membrane protein